MSQDVLIYGANGYTGSLIAQLAARRGQRPILAGRNRAEVTALAARLNLPCCVVDLRDPAALDGALAGVRVVLHCAGPFIHTAGPMVDACLRAGVHYLDITGEIAVFEALAARSAAARAAGVMLLPGVGFDVVPTDCLAAHLTRRLPAATRLSLGFQALGRVSPGTAATAIEHLGQGGMVRQGGILRRVPVAHRTRTIDFGRGPRLAVAIPWGDVATAYYSTGIPNIEVYMAIPSSFRWGLAIARYAAPLLGLRPIKSWLKTLVRQGQPGPSDTEMEQGKSLVWGEAADSAGRRVASRLRGPEGYRLTALTALAAVEKVLAGNAPPGFQTPSRAYGADFILEIPDVSREDV